MDGDAIIQPAEVPVRTAIIFAGKFEGLSVYDLATDELQELWDTTYGSLHALATREWQRRFPTRPSAGRRGFGRSRASGRGGLLMA